MKPKNNFYYSISDRLGTYDIAPLGESDFTLDYERENEDKFDYNRNLSGKIVLVGDDFYRIMQMEGSIYRCDEQTLTILKKCGNNFKSIFTGNISLNDADVNLDKCKITLKTLDDARDKCIKDGKSEKINLFEFIWDRITVKTKANIGTIETKFCSTNSNQYVDAYYWCDSGEPHFGNWTAVSASNFSPDGVHFSAQTQWKREIVEIDCNEIPEPDWILIQDNCGSTGKKKYAQKVTLYNCSSSTTPEDENGAFSYERSCEVLGYDGQSYQIDNGVHFTKVMTELVKKSCPNLIVKSDFFQINPDNISTVNYVTGQSSKVNNIIVFQKSDVKRPNVSGNASKMEITLDKMLENLKKMFNVKWRIEGNVFRLEHISYFQANQGIDVTTNALQRFFVGKRVYSYESAKIPQKEIFDFKERGSNDWMTEVEYSGCVMNKKDNIINNLIDDIATDIVYVMSNPDAESDKVKDEGLVFISTRKIGDDYYINIESNPNGGRLNNVFSFPALFRDYHKYERPMKRAKVNGVMTQFISSLPIKKGEKFAIPLCVCETDFDPDDTIKTALGDGIVSAASYRFKDEMLELDLLYEANMDLQPNDAPIITGGGVFYTYQGITKVVPISVSDPDGFIQAVQIVYPPNSGTVVINSTFDEITYTPNPGFVGMDVFSVRAIDNYQEISNTINFGIVVQATNVAPVAVNDNFNVFIGQTFNQPLSIFQNDSDDYNQFTIVNSNLTTAQGVAISINSAGFFNYTPPSGFTGIDTFQYEIKDDLNQISSATVTLNVINYDSPVAENDVYQTKIGVTLISDGSLLKKKLTNNDYTPNGQPYTYTCNVENKATALGGNIQIQADGNFIYTPPVGVQYEGEQDSTTYTVNNQNGSDQGEIRINILPNIFVKLIKNNITNQGHFGDPIFTRTADYTLFFYSDSGMTTPIDVTGMGMRILIKQARTFTNGGNSNTSMYIWKTDECSGTSYKFYDDFMWYDSWDSGSVVNEIIISIEPDNSYNII